jgi:hypothetical protein
VSKNEEWLVTVQREGGPVIPRRFTDEKKAKKVFKALAKAAGDTVEVCIYGPK